MTLSVYRWCFFLAVFAGSAWLPDSAHALNLSGALSWDYARTQNSSGLADVVQNSFGQSYQMGLSGTILHQKIGTWHSSGSWRRDLTHFSGVQSDARDTRLTDFNVGVLLFPGVMPMSLGFRRSLVDSGNDGTIGSNTVSSTLSLSTQIRMPDGEPLSVTAQHSTRDTGGGDSRTRLLSLSKRFHFGARQTLTSSYQYSQFNNDLTTDTGHGISLSHLSTWTETLTSSLFANVSSRNSTSALSTLGRTAFINNSVGGGVTYRRGNAMYANLLYSFTESPQAQAKDIRNHLLSGRMKLQLNDKTDMTSNFTLRRLGLGETNLSTVTGNAGLRYRPKFGWATGGRIGFSQNDTTGINSSSRQSYSASAFLSGRHILVPVDVNWGGDVNYSTTRGGANQDRVTLTAHGGAEEKQLQWVRSTADYRLTSIHEARGNTGLDPITLEHGASLGFHLVPLEGLWLNGDALRASGSVSNFWNREYTSGRSTRSTTLAMGADYVAWSGLVANASYQFSNNSTAVTSGSHTLQGGASWSRRVLRRGTSKLRGTVSRSYQGAGFISDELGLGYSFDYAIGLVRIAFQADTTFVSLSGQREGNQSNSVRLNIVRTF